MFFKPLAVAFAIGSVSAQRPSNTSICDFYTTALLKNNTAANQRTLLTLLVNTAVIGNYTQPNVGVSVPGILAAGTYNGTAVNLLPYFNGGLASTNRGGNVGQAVNFLDGGGAAPLRSNMPANDQSSNQYTLLTHLYEYFGSLLGCTQMNTTAFPSYNGAASQYNVHKFMDLSPYEVGYFIQQVALSASSFGVAQSDIAAAGTALNSLFNVRCAPSTVVVPSQPAELQSICLENSCPLAPNNTCSAYAASVQPGVANATLAGNATSTTPGGSTQTTATSGVGRVVAELGGAVVSSVLLAGVFVFLL
ncbi:hypothetical protein HYALB_00012543 [Hymenoscyphus albidus]|uniref:Secreted protein n=1 Tax=Hymenoscyphus albidus TaxID=595503 RepID=A0A9N9Q785_9HELO|nr:hypothetical protein HYALB_00012543 [Hymenoscyphus albidus]